MNDNGRIFGIGASAKGNTFLNFYNLGYKIVSGVTDISKEKLNKYTPGTHIKIVKDDILKDYNNIYVIMLSWNIKSIRHKIKKINKNIKFIN